MALVMLTEGILTLHVVTDRRMQTTVLIATDLEDKTGQILSMYMNQL